MIRIVDANNTDVTSITHEEFGKLIGQGLTLLDLSTAPANVLKSHRKKDENGNYIDGTEAGKFVRLDYRPNVESIRVGDGMVYPNSVQATVSAFKVQSDPHTTEAKKKAEPRMALTFDAFKAAAAKK